MSKSLHSVAALFVCVLIGCVSEPQNVSQDSTASSVRQVRFVGAPENPELAEKARQLGNAYYPEIYATLNGGTPEVPQFDIVFRKDLARHYKQSVKRTTQNMPKMMDYYPSGVAARGNVYLDLETFVKEPGTLDRILLHEMAHIAQRYSWYRRVTMPYYWQEGIAEAMVFKLENVNLPKDRPCKCSAVWPHYLSGYSCTASFLLFLERTYDPQLVFRLNSAMRDGSYRDDFFDHATGRTLDQLWPEFLQTDNVTPLAAKINKIYQELGYRNGKPPRNVQALFKAYLAKQPKGNELIRMLDLADSDDRKTTDIQALITRSVYLAGPGGSIIEAGHLHEQGRLPGMNKGDTWTLWEAKSILDLDLQEQNSPHELHARRDGDPSTYHYQFLRACDNCGWTLDKAWRTDENGAVVEQYVIEHN